MGVTYRLADPEQWRREPPAGSFGLIELDGEPAGYAIYRIKSDWQDGFSQSQVRLVEAIATSPAATRELYRFIYGIDLTVRVARQIDPGSPLFLMVIDARSLHLKVNRGPLAADRRPRRRTCRTLVRTETMPSSSTSKIRSVPGTPGAGGSARRWSGRMTKPTSSSTLPTLRPPISAPSTSNDLAAAERVREVKEGALARADELFRTPRPPFCPEDF